MSGYGATVSSSVTRKRLGGFSVPVKIEASTGKYPLL